MEAIAFGGHHQPGIKKTGKKKASRKSRAANRRDRDLQSGEATTSSETPKDTPEETSEIFYDATEVMEIESLGYRCTAAAPSVGSPRSPEKDVTQTRSENSGVPDIQQAPSPRKSYGLKQYSHSTGHSIGIQTVDEDEINRRDQQSFINDDEHLLIPSDDVYEDALETLTDHEFPLERGKDHGKTRQNTEKERDKYQKLGSKDACQLKNGNVDCYQRSTAAREAAGHRQETSCCWWLLTVLFWLGVVMLILLLLTLFLVVFLLFSRNHSLGIGPSLIYSDVDVVRSAVNPSLDLRHNGPPPT